MKSLLLITLVLGFSTSAFAKVAVGKVDVQKVLVSVNQGVAVRDQLKKAFEEKQKILKDEEDKIRKMQDDYQKKATVLNDKEKMKKEREIQEKIMTIQQKTSGFQKEIHGLQYLLDAFPKSKNINLKWIMLSSLKYRHS
jgi:outer membrane protein